MKDIRLNIITPESVLVDEMVDNVTLPGTMGSFQVLKDHAALLSSLTKGNVRYVSEGKASEIAIRSGFVEVLDNVVSVCVEI